MNLTQKQFRLQFMYHRQRQGSAGNFFGILKRLSFSNCYSNGYNNLHSYWITGFVDAEGCFNIRIIEKKRLKLGWEVQLCFIISLHKKDIALLEQSFLGVGNITKQGKDSVQFRVTSVKDLRVIINHFDKYPLITQKFADYQLFKQVVDMVNRKEHLTEEGLRKIIAIKASNNNGLTKTLKAAFPNISPVPRLKVTGQRIPDPHWIAGFVYGEGCFYVVIKNCSTNISGFQAQLKFQITQHIRDEELLISLVDYFGCGQYFISKGRDWGDFTLTKFSDITVKILPFFDKYPLQGVKSLDYADFKRVSELMKAKAHLTSEGLEQIRIIKSGMNKGR